MTVHLMFHYNAITHENIEGVLHHYLAWWKETCYTYGVKGITVVDTENLLEGRYLNKKVKRPRMVRDDRCDVTRIPAIPVLASFDEGVPMPEFEHPIFANYIFGHDEGDYETVVRDVGTVVRIPTPVNHPLWQISAAAVLLHDRFQKGPYPETLPGAGKPSASE